jgi:hypothetical protein
MKTQVVILLSFIVGISCSTKSNEEEITTDRSNWDHLTELEFPEAYPTEQATEILYDENAFPACNTICFVVNASYDFMVYEKRV